MRQLCVTIQLKFEVEKAQKLTDRLEELHRQAANRRLQLQKKLPKEPTEEQKEQLAEAEATELDLNMVNFLRSLLSASMDKMLELPDDKLTAIIRANKLPRGRPKDKERLSAAGRIQ